MSDGDTGSAGDAFFLRLVNAARPLHHHAWLGDAVGLALFAVALGLRLLIDGVLPPGFPFLTFFPAVILSTFMCGLRPGVICATLSTLAAWFFFIGPESGMVFGVQAALALGFFTVISAIDIALVHFTFRAVERLYDEKAVTAKLYEQQRTMFQELQHRVANNMQFVAALLSLHRRQATADPQSALATLDEARTRLETISRMHRRLYDPDRLALPIEPYLRELCGDLLDAAGARNVTCKVTAPPVALNVSQLTTLSLLTAEIITNSLKHAFAPEEAGLVDVSVTPTGPDRYRMTIADNGQGMPKDFDPAQHSSLGLRIVQGLASQLNGQVRYESDEGTKVVVEFSTQA